MSGRDIEKSIVREMSGNLESGMLAVGKNTRSLAPSNTESSVSPRAEALVRCTVDVRVRC